MTTVAGVDLAWMSSRNPTALAWGTVAGKTLEIAGVAENIYGVDAVVGQLARLPALSGIAIDAPLIIPNATGQRACERAIGSAYSSRKAACHTSNLKLYPHSDSVALALRLQQLGFSHLGCQAGRWQLECYPHPALIEIFGLPERHQYKKGRVQDRRRGQVRLAQMIRRLAGSPVLRLTIPDVLSAYFDAGRIPLLRGQALKHNEDVLDAILCAYIAGLFHIGVDEKVFGDASMGYIYVPQQPCL